MRYCIGIDSGGTGISASAISSQGELLFTEKGGSGNLTVNFDIAFANILQTADMVYQKMGQYPAGVCLGSAGIGTADYRTRLENALHERFHAPVVVVNDGILALNAAVPGDNGILMIAGTGSIGYAKCKGELIRCGGWGHLVGDEGSGYQISLAAYRQIYQQYDQGVPYSPLSKAILQKHGMQGAEEMNTFLYRASKPEIAAALPLVASMAQSGDAEALTHLQNAGNDLAGMALTLCRRAAFGEPYIAMHGGVLRNVTPVREAFMSKILSRLPQAHMEIFQGNASMGGFPLLRAAGYL